MPTTTKGVIETAFTTASITAIIDAVPANIDEHHLTQNTIERRRPIPATDIIIIIVIVVPVLIDILAGLPWTSTASRTKTILIEFM